MGYSLDAMRMDYPLSTYNYRVHFGSVTLAFTEVSGLSVNYENQVYRDGLSYTRGFSIVRGFSQPINITLKRGVVHNGNPAFNDAKKEWIDAFFNKEVKDITIELCDEQGVGLVQWKVMKALPIKFDAPQLDANSNNIAIESMEFIGHSIKMDFNKFSNDVYS